jgi:heptosyltransferase-1
MDKHSARESIAARFYQNTYAVPRGQHAVPRNRQLVAQVLNYDLAALPLDYGLVDKRLIDGGSLDSNLPERCAVFLHAASTPEKEWSVTQWISLGKKMNKRGLSVLLPWGDSREHGNAVSIASELEQAVVLPRMGLPDLARLFFKAEVLVGEDSGLSHMAAALDRPIVALYLVTDPALTGMMASEVSKDNRVINCQVENAEQDVIKVADILYKWLPTAD